MRSIRRAVLAAGLAVGLTAAALPATPSAEAAVCRSRMAGEGTGLGIMGLGTAMARQNALANWSSKVSAKHGPRFATTAKARSVKYDCRQGAILQAKCVVTAIPCR